MEVAASSQLDVLYTGSAFKGQILYIGFRTMVLRYSTKHSCSFETAYINIMNSLIYHVALRHILMHSAVKWTGVTKQVI
jgi:hypothetical protein